MILFALTQKIVFRHLLGIVICAKGLILFFRAANTIKKLILVSDIYLQSIVNIRLIFHANFRLEGLFTVSFLSTVIGCFIFDHSLITVDLSKVVQIMIISVKFSESNEVIYTATLCGEQGLVPLVE